ncbi:MAG: MFS transporter [Aeromicrobium sp.]
MRIASAYASVTPVDTVTRARTAHVAFALIALALGGFAIGTTEFVTMGLLPEITTGIGEDIPTTGHIITAYALGVVVGAPVIVSIGAHLPKRELAIGLVLALGLGNAITAMASGYWPVMIARFLAGLPHGAYFGVASLIAASLVTPEFRGRAISSVMLGLSVATVVGVPASTWLGQNLGWRSAYWSVLGLAVITAIALWIFVPHSGGNHEASIRKELSALKRPPVLFAVATGMVGFGGIFAMYSYIAPAVTDVTQMSRSFIPWFLFAFGVGSVVGTWVAGRLADWNVQRSVIGGFVTMAAVLALFVVASPYVVPALFLVFVAGAIGSVIAICLQVRLMHAAGDAQMLGAALNHSALNVANGLGASLGSIVIAADFGYRAPSAVGVGLALGGLAIFGASIWHQKRSELVAHPSMIDQRLRRQDREYADLSA